MDTNTASPDDRWNVMAAACPTRQVVAAIGDKWTLLVLYALETRGSQRFSQLQRTVEGITQKVLTQTLRQLERHGLISRYVHATVPPRVDYELTALGKSLSGTIAELRSWAYSNIEFIREAQIVYDENVDGDSC